MPQSLVQIPIQLVFSTHHRQPLLTDLDQRHELHRYMSGICRNLGSPAICINGPDDHVHVLCYLGKEQRICDLVRDLKSNSCKWYHRRFPHPPDFHWQKGYGAFGANPNDLTTLVKYILNQEEHHRQISFKEEIRRLCREADVVIDERYVWE
jgi:REP element-mobilizing transposase RayT